MNSDRTHNCGVLARFAANYSYRICERGFITILFRRCVDGNRCVTLARSEEQVAFETMLFGVKLVVAALDRVKFFVSATLDNSALLDDENLIGAADRG